MQVSPCSSSRRTRAGALWLLALCAALATGCATVRPEEREHLSQPAMTFGASMARSHEEHVLANREAAFGGSDARGGGCGCN